MSDEEHRVEFNESEPLRDNCNAIPGYACSRNNTLITDGVNTTDAYGIFGELTFDLSDSLMLVVGGRYSSDSRTLDYDTFGYGDSSGLRGVGFDSPDPTRDCEAIVAAAGNPAPPPGTVTCGTIANPVGYEGSVKGDWDDFSPKVSLTWAINDNNNIYALYSEGFKAGGFQQDARWEEALDRVLDPEEATNLEFGWKGAYDNIVFAGTVCHQ